MSELGDRTNVFEFEDGILDEGALWELLNTRSLSERTDVAVR